MKTGSVKGTGK